MELKKGAGSDGEQRAKGIEPFQSLSISPQNHADLEAGGAKAALTQSLPMDADEDLRLVVDAWDTLPAAVKAGIVAMVRAARS